MLISRDLRDELIVKIMTQFYCKHTHMHCTSVNEASCILAFTASAMHFLRSTGQIYGFHPILQIWQNFERPQIEVAEGLVLPIIEDPIS